MQSAPQVHPNRLERQVSWHRFAAAWRFLIGSDLPSAIARELGLAVTDQNVRDWRRGVTGIPAWVLEKTRQRLAKARTDLTAHEIALATITPAAGMGSHGNIQRWNVSRARERESPQQNSYSRVIHAIDADGHDALKPNFERPALDKK